MITGSERAMVVDGYTWTRIPGTATEARALTATPLALRYRRSGIAVGKEKSPGDFPCRWVDEDHLFTRPWIPSEFPVNFEVLTTVPNTAP
ncbi:MAG: hypothetical protein ACJ72I_24645 [Pseudonocardiaceae bacterium]|jgi:hypothetical protein